MNIEALDAAPSWTDEDLAAHFATAHAIVAAKLTRKVRAELGLA